MKIKLIRGWIRLFIWGYCPECNGDSPKYFDCKICLGWHVKNRYKKPSRFMRLCWWDFFKIQNKR